MWTDAVNLQAFYASGLGEVAARMIVRRIREVWPDARGLTMLGLGYATPFLEPFRAEAGRVLAVMPAAQGVVPWPDDGNGLAMLAEEDGLPLPDRSVDRVLVAHALECSEQTRPMMRELWRVLADGGRLLVVAPNRRGLWARFERTPFGQGRPYSSDQLIRGLSETMFTPCRAEPALFVPPVRSPMVLSSAAAWERVGQRWFASLAGVLIAEASKEIYTGRFNFSPAEAKAYAPIVPR